MCTKNRDTHTYFCEGVHKTSKQTIKLKTLKSSDFCFLVCCLLSRSAMCSLISRRYRRSAVTCVRRQYPVLEWGSNSSRVGLGLINQSRKRYTIKVFFHSVHLWEILLLQVVHLKYTSSKYTSSQITTCSFRWFHLQRDNTLIPSQKMNVYCAKNFEVFLSFGFMQSYNFILHFCHDMGRTPKIPVWSINTRGDCYRLTSKKGSKALFES